MRTGSSENKDFLVYPNPFKTDIKIQITANKNTEASLRLTNAAGQTIVSKKVQVQKGANVIVLANELSATSPGIYVVEITVGEERYLSKLLKK